ncbi:hypothetical protein As57867_025224, partial [Aphanomyces stellatus]
MRFAGLFVLPNPGAPVPWVYCGQGAGGGSFIVSVSHGETPIGLQRKGHNVRAVVSCEHSMPPPPGHMSRRSSHVVPTTPTAAMASHTRKNSNTSRMRKRPSIIPQDDLTTLPLLDLPASSHLSNHRSEAMTPPTSNFKATWITPRLADELRGDKANNGVLSLEKSLELLEKILTTEGAHDATASSSSGAARAGYTTPHVTVNVPKPTRLGEVDRKPSMGGNLSAPQRIEELYDTISILRQELELERSQKRATDGTSGGIVGYAMDAAGDNYYAALGRNAELHIRAKKFESAANSMRDDLEASKNEQKRTLDHVNAREEKLRNLIKKNKCLMAEYEVLKDQYVEEKVKSVEVYRTMQLEKKRNECAKDEMEAIKTELTKDNADLRVKVDEMTKAHATQVHGLQTALRDAQTERDRLVLCVAESRHRFKAWKDREAKAVRVARDEAKEAMQLEHSIRIGRCQDEIHLLRDKVTQLEQSNQLLKREPNLSPLELTQRKQQLLNTITTQEADLIAMTARVQELETMLAFTKTQQEHQDAMLQTAQEAMANMLHDREVQALEHLTWNSGPSRKPSTAPMSPTASASVFPLKSPTSPMATPRAPSTAPSPRVQQSKRKGQYKKAGVASPSGPTPPPSTAATAPTPPPGSSMDANLTVSSWKQEVRGLTEQVEEYKAMIISLSSEIEKLKMERKRVAVQKQSDLVKQHQDELAQTQKELDAAKASEKAMSDALEKYRDQETNKAAQLIQMRTRGAIARYKLKAKLKATRLLQAQLRGFAARKRTNLINLRRPSVVSAREQRRVESPPVKSTDDMDVYVDYIPTPPCVKVELWYHGELFTKFVPNRSVALYVVNGTAMIAKSPEELRAKLAHLVYYDTSAHALALPMLPPEDPVEKERKEAIRRIQSRARGYLVRNDVHKENERRQSAAALIQSQAKGYLARAEYARQSEAIVAIQAQAKGYVARKRYKKQRSALVQIQATAKGCLERRAFEYKRASIAKIQAQSKGYLARKSFEAKKEAAVKIQAVSKGRMHRQSYLEQQEKAKAAKSIQARAKGFLLRKDMAEKQSAAVKIQSHLKGHAARRETKRKTESATRIQSAHRAFMEKQIFQAKKRAICKIQAGMKGYRERQRICLRPRLQRLNEADEDRADHRFRRHVDSSLVEFRIHCLEHPPCVKIEALLHRHVYTTFVKYQDINCFVGFGTQLFHENPETLAKTFEPLCSLAADNSEHGYHILIKKNWDLIGSLKDPMLGGQSHDAEAASEALAAAIAKKLQDVDDFAARLNEDNIDACLFDDGDVVASVCDDERPDEIGDDVQESVGPSAAIATAAIVVTALAEAAAIREVLKATTPQGQGVDYESTEPRPSLAITMHESADVSLDATATEGHDELSNAAPAEMDTTATTAKQMDTDVGTPDDTRESQSGDESKSVTESDDEISANPVEIPMWLVELDMDEEDANFKTVLCAVEEDNEHLSTSYSVANMRYSISHAPVAVETVNNLQVIYGSCSEDLFDVQASHDAVETFYAARALATEWTNQIVLAGVAKLSRPRRASTNLEELLLDVDSLIQAGVDETADRPIEVLLLDVDSLLDPAADNPLPNNVADDKTKDTMCALDVATHMVHHLLIDAVDEVALKHVPAKQATDAPSMHTLLAGESQATTDDDDNQLTKAHAVVVVESNQGDDLQLPEDPPIDTLTETVTLVTDPMDEAPLPHLENVQSMENNETGDSDYAVEEYPTNFDSQPSLEPEQAEEVTNSQSNGKNHSEVAVCVVELAIAAGLKTFVESKAKRKQSLSLDVFLLHCVSDSVLAPMELEHEVENALVDDEACAWHLEERNLAKGTIQDDDGSRHHQDSPDSKVIFLNDGELVSQDTPTRSETSLKIAQQFVDDNISQVVLKLSPTRKPRRSNTLDPEPPYSQHQKQFSPTKSNLTNSSHESSELNFNEDVQFQTISNIERNQHSTFTQPKDHSLSTKDNIHLQIAAHQFAQPPEPVEAPLETTEEPTPVAEPVEEQAPFDAPVEAVEDPPPDPVEAAVESPVEEPPATEAAAVESTEPVDAAVAEADLEPVETSVEVTEEPTPVAEPVEGQAPVDAPVEAVEDTPPAPVEAAVEPPVEEPPATEAAAVVPTEPVDTPVAEASPEPVEAPLDTTDPPSSVAEPVEEQAPVVAPVEAVEDTPPARVEADVEPPVEELPATEAAAVVPTIEHVVAEAAPELVEAPLDTTDPLTSVAEPVEEQAPVVAPVEAVEDAPLAPNPRLWNQPNVDAAVAEAAPEPVEAPLDTTDPPTSVAEPLEEQAPVVAPVEAVEDTPPAPVEAAVEPPVEEPPATEASAVVSTIDAAVAEASPEPVEAPLDTTDPPTSVAEPVEEQAPVVAPVEAVEDTPPASVEAAVEPPVEEPPTTESAAVESTEPVDAAVAVADFEPVEASVEVSEEPTPVAEPVEEEAPVVAPVEAVEDPLPAPVEADAEPLVEEPPATESAAVESTEPVDAAVADAAREPIEAHLDTTDPPSSVAEPVEEQAPVVAPVEAVEDTPPARVEADVEPPVEEPPATEAAVVVPTEPVDAAVAEADVVVPTEPVDAAVADAAREPIEAHL